MKPICVKAQVDLISSAHCQATTKGGILVVFSAPSNCIPKLGDVVQIDLAILDVPQEISNLTKSNNFQAVIKRNDVHDTRMSVSHGTSRFPSPDRLREA